MKPQMIIFEMPNLDAAWRDPATHRTLRHWLILADGRVFYQDEFLSIEDAAWVSIRGQWESLPTPPTHPLVVGLIDYGGIPMRVFQDGRTELLVRVEGRDVWREFLT